MTHEEKKKLVSQIKEVSNRTILENPLTFTYNFWLVEELAKAWAALEFYADENAWEIATGKELDQHHDYFLPDDAGKRAREALNG